MPTILLLSASPLDQDRLRLGAELRDIRHALQRSSNREKWKIESNEAATVDDLRRALLDFQPTIVHFSGHGGGAAGLCFEALDGTTHATNSKPLGKLFHHFKHNLKCVFLNACYSSEQGEEIRREIDNVIGMRDTVGDDSAIKFSVAFYDAVFAGTDFRTAFDLACTALDLNSMPDSNVPIFMTSPHLEGRILSYNAKVPEIERLLYAYLNTTYEDRYPFTTTGEPLRPLMKQHYGERMLPRVDKVQVLTMDKVEDKYWRVQVKVVSGAENWESLFYLKICDRSILIEWEATVGLWSMPVKTYLAVSPSEPIVVRVHAQLSTYYNYYYLQKQNKYLSIELRYRGGEAIHGYVERNSKIYDELMEILSDGNSHPITLEIINNNGESSVSSINKLLSCNWIYREDSDA